MNFVFVGTPDFAAQVLRHLDDLGRRPALVLSQPDRPRGRGRRPATPAAVAMARHLSIDTVQVDDINSVESVARIGATGAEVVVVAAFGQMLKPVLLDSFLCLNIHASLLPAYRGAAPIERALAAGERRTGVSIMRMTEGLDEGPWAMQSSVSVGLRDDAGSVGRVLAVLGALGLDQVLTGLADCTVTWTEQRGVASYAAKLCAADAVLDPTLTAAALHDQVRALSPHVGARTSSGNLELKIWRTWPYGQAGLDALPSWARAISGSPGALLTVGSRLFLGCREGAVEVLLVQPAGKGKMTTAEFLRGYASRLERALNSSHPACSGPWDDRDPISKREREQE